VTGTHTFVVQPVPQFAHSLREEAAEPLVLLQFVAVLILWRLRG
jgi:hypothetical protein